MVTLVQPAAPGHFGAVPCLHGPVPVFSLPLRGCLVPLCSAGQGAWRGGAKHQAGTIGLCAFAGMGLYCTGGTPSLVEDLSSFCPPINVSSVAALMFAQHEGPWGAPVTGRLLAVPHSHCGSTGTFPGLGLSLLLALSCIGLCREPNLTFTALLRFSAPL